MNKREFKSIRLSDGSLYWGELKNQKPHGVGYIVDVNKSEQSFGTFKNGVSHGFLFVFKKNKEVSNFEYVEGIIHGKVLHYLPNDETIFSDEYKNGELMISISYTLSGLMTTERFKDGKKHGMQNILLENGFQMQRIFENGENINHPITNKKWAQSETPKPEAKKNGIKIYNDLKNHICSLYWIVPKELEEIIKDEKNKIDN